MQWIRLIVIGVRGCCAMPMAGAASSSDYPDVSITEQPSEHPSDAQLRRQVEEALHKDVRIHWEALGVKVFDGKVDVFGIVRTPEEKALVTSSRHGSRQSRAGTLLLA